MIFILNKTQNILKSFKLEKKLKKIIDCNCQSVSGSSNQKISSQMQKFPHFSWISPSYLFGKPTLWIWDTNENNYRSSEVPDLFSFNPFNFYSATIPDTFSRFGIYGEVLCHSSSKHMLLLHLNMWNALIAMLLVRDFTFLLLFEHHFKIKSCLYTNTKEWLRNMCWIKWFHDS